MNRKICLPENLNVEWFMTDVD